MKLTFNLLLGAAAACIIMWSVWSMLLVAYNVGKMECRRPALLERNVL